MAIIDLHSKEFDEATITKLELFEYYAKEFGIEYHSKIRRTQWGESLLS